MQNINIIVRCEHHTLKRRMPKIKTEKNKRFPLKNDLDFIHWKEILSKNLISFWEAMTKNKIQTKIIYNPKLTSSFSTSQLTQLKKRSPHVDPRRRKGEKKLGR
jgi:hypothetical protein